MIIVKRILELKTYNTEFLSAFLRFLKGNWENVSKSILSFSKCDKSKYMSFTTVFYNKNFQFFQNWINEYIHSSNRWKIILVANSLINKDISWAYKFFPIPDTLLKNGMK